MSAFTYFSGGKPVSLQIETPDAGPSRAGAVPRRVMKAGAWDKFTGHGRLNAFAALRLARGL